MLQHEKTTAGFWARQSGVRGERTVVVQLTNGAVCWIQSFAPQVGKYFNAATMHSKASTAEIAKAVKEIADAVDGQGRLGTTYRQHDFPGHLYPHRNRVEALPGPIKGYLMDGTDDLDMSAAVLAVL